MADTTSATDPARLRASDADREVVASVLQEAVAEGRITLAELQERLDVVYRAKLIGDLAPVTADLPAHVRLAAPATSPVTAAPPPAGPESTVAVAVMSGGQRRGDWLVPARFTAVAVMGGVELDLTEARFASRQVTIHAFAVMGGIDITVPDGVDVRTHGFGLMGGFERFRRRTPPPAGAPVVHVRGFALMGGVCLRRPGDPR